jgi:hypothetical protein
LVGKPFDETRLANYINSSVATTNAPLVLADQIAIAQASRCDLKAIESLCRSLSVDTLPMARQWLGALQPGLGVAIAIAARKPILAAFHSDDRALAELCKRREQCTQLRDERLRQIESEVHVAFVEYQTATTRQAIAKEHLELTSTAVEQVLKAIELEQASPGADLLAKLEQLESQGRLIDRQVAVAVAQVKLKEATGTLATQTP